MEEWQLRQKQSLPLEQKIIMSQRRITEWYNHYGGQVYVSLSGGKDSTVLLHLVRELYPDVPALFIDTGLEYPEIRQFVDTVDNVTKMRPQKTFREVLLEYGYPIISKDVAQRIEAARRGAKWAINNLNGMDKRGNYNQYNQRYKKYKYLVNAPFKVSDKCCKVNKKQPARKYERETGRKAYIGIMAEESDRRKSAYLKTGCNAYTSSLQMSKPLGFWTEQDILQYIKYFRLPYASVYGDIVQTSKGKLITTGLKRTGCMYCAYGIHLDKTNSFQKMSQTHPKIYDYCLRPVDEGGLGMAQVLDYIGVPYEIRQQSLNFGT